MCRNSENLECDNFIKSLKCVESPNCVKASIVCKRLNAQATLVYKNSGCVRDYKCVGDYICKGLQEMDEKKHVMECVKNEEQ